MKKLFNYTLPVVALCVLASCSEDTTTGGTDATDTYNGKELISFAGDGNGITRAYLTRASQGFDAVTKVVMRIKSEEVVASTPTAVPARYTETTATATANKPASGEDADPHSSLVGAHSDLSYVVGQERFWDDAHGRNSKLTVYAFAIPNKTDATLPTWSKQDWNPVNISTNPNWNQGTWYTTVTWSVGTEESEKIKQTAATMEENDLTYSNNISESGTGGRYTYDYDTSADPNVLKTDLKMGDGQMIWQSTVKNQGTTGKFDQGHLIFNHALSWIEINLKEGDGFNNSSVSDFVWTNPNTQNITLKSFYTSGTLDVSAVKGSEWSGQSSKDITLMNELAATVESEGKTTRHLHAYTIPGNNLMTTTSNVIEFEIDNAKYYVTGKQIAEAIQAYAVKNSLSYIDFTTTKAGEHYVINLTVSKKGIDRITAAIVSWETVNGNADAKNTYPSFTLEDRSRDRGSRLEGTTEGSDDGAGKQFNIYRSAQTASDYITGTETKNWDWQNGYWSDGAATKTWKANTLTAPANNSHWATTWFWPDNKTYYHFRAAGYTENTTSPLTLTTGTENVADPGKDLDYFTITSGTTTSSNYKDYIWGAPFKDIASTAKFTYSTTNGFDLESRTDENYQINPGIGVNDEEINMVLFHMTSQVFVNIKTISGPGAVSLKDESKDLKLTKVEILNFLPDGRVLMGNGLVQTTGSTRTEAAQMTNGSHKAASGNDPEEVNGYSYGIVPQPLSFNSGTTTGTIGLRITTPDGNQYFVRDLSTCTASSVTSNNISNPYGTSAPYTIGQWLPNYQYTYNITISKKQIERITAAVVGWEEVTGNNIDIDLEN